MWAPAVVAALTAPRLTRPTRLRLSAAAVGVTAVVLTYGMVRLDDPLPGPRIRVAAVVAALPADDLADCPYQFGCATPGPLFGTAAGSRLIEADLRALDAVPEGTHVVVFPEKDLIVDEVTILQLSARFAPAAHTEGSTPSSGWRFTTGQQCRTWPWCFPPTAEQWLCLGLTVVGIGGVSVRRDRSRPAG
jgi:hypothetical protein